MLLSLLLVLHVRSSSVREHHVELYSAITASPTGCTFWGKKPWTRKKKLLWQLGVGVPIMLAYVYGVVPLSLCRNGGCGITESNPRIDDLNDEDLWDLASRE
ncbi:hypothetical protein ANCDUO_00180 [Ancylostoma duodenale]|uniref:Uncharacterized protein n=1 Tax=Ancylostoma duodenale TaxID=51022 RepID=A0A0C2HIR8_9BILA|nr:hypothetical protein ANCDUO_00180 [Ancylostoma duodenale]